MNGRSRIDLSLVEDSKNLSEVVVVGYGVTKRRDLVSSVSSISGKELNEFKTGRCSWSMVSLSILAG